MGFQVRGGGGYASEINITPLVDVVLVLLIIFMMIVPVMLRGHDVDVPGESVVAPNDERAEQIVLTIDVEDCPVLEPLTGSGLPSNCTVRLNAEEIAAADLAERVGATFAEREPSERTLFLAAGDRLNYEGVMRIVDAARSGVDDLRIGLVTGP